MRVNTLSPLSLNAAIHRDTGYDHYVTFTKEELRILKWKFPIKMFGLLKGLERAPSHWLTDDDFKLCVRLGFKVTEEII